MKKKGSGILIKILALLSVVVVIFAGGYFFLDKSIVPKYFGQYGINGVGDLIGVVSSLYDTPKESKFVTNAYSQSDFTNAIAKLQGANYLIADDGSILEEEGRLFKGDKEVKLTDREFAAVCNNLLKDNILVDSLPDLKYLNIINISVLQVVFEVDKDSYVEAEGIYTKADVSFIAKVDTTGIREQIAVQMKTPLYLLKMIIPDKIYFEAEYELDLTKEESERVQEGVLEINSKSAKQSEIVIGLLIQFIFPESDEMTIEKFTADFGDIILQGIDFFGKFTFVDNLGVKGNQTGILVK